jgi:predicted nucleic acid-binding protein
LRSICIDANVFLHVLIPGRSKADRANVEASAGLIDLLQDEKIEAVVPSIALAEIRWVLGRANRDLSREELKLLWKQTEQLILDCLRKSLRVVDIDTSLATLAAEYRLDHYSQKNDFSYNDGLYLAVAVMNDVDCLVSTDTHLLKAKEIRVLDPAHFLRLKRGG